MLKVENISIRGFEEALRGMRNPKDSWNRTDSEHLSINEYVKKYGKDNLEITISKETPEQPDIPVFTLKPDFDTIDRNRIIIDTLPHYSDIEYFGDGIIPAPVTMDTIPILGKNDLKLANALCRGGPVHGKFVRFIQVYIDITASFDFWREMDTYRMGKESNSCSTMHRITKNPISIDNYSTADLRPQDVEFMKKNIEYYKSVLDDESLTDLEKTRILSKINMTGFEQKRTLMLSYETLHNIATWRKGHKLEEWRYLVNAIIMKFPYFEYFFFK